LTVRFPVGLDAIRSATELKKISGIPNVVAIIDGTHVRIRRPGIN
jgi:hypothetical protein